MKKIRQVLTATGMYKYSWLLLFLCSVNGNIFAGSKWDTIRDFLYPKSNIYLTTHPAFSPKPVITSFENTYNMEVKLKGVMNLNFGMVYLYNFNRYMGISAGFYSAFLSFKTLKFDFNIPNQIYPEMHYQDAPCFKCKEFINHATTFPFRFIGRIAIAKKIDLVSSVGIDVQLQRSFYYEYDIIYDPLSTTINPSPPPPTFVIILENRGHKNISVLPYFGGSIGINQLLKNKHYINYQFSAHIPFWNPYDNGSFYLLPGTPYEEYGTFKLNPMSFGLEINYVFTFRKRKEWNDKSLIRYYNMKK